MLLSLSLFLRIVFLFDISITSIPHFISLLNFYPFRKDTLSLILYSIFIYLFYLFYLSNPFIYLS